MEIVLQPAQLEEQRFGDTILVMGWVSFRDSPNTGIVSVRGHVCGKLPKELDEHNEAQSWVLHPTVKCEHCGIVAVEAYANFHNPQA